MPFLFLMLLGLVVAGFVLYYLVELMDWCSNLVTALMISSETILTSSNNKIEKNIVKTTSWAVVPKLLDNVRSEYVGNDIFN